MQKIDKHTGAAGINNNGDMIGAYSIPFSMTARGFVYSNGSMIDLGTLPDRMDSSPQDINNRGQIVGYTHNDSYDPLAFIYENNAMIDLNSLVDPTDGYRLVGATSINDVGQILATRCTGEWLMSCQQVLLNPVVAQIPVPEPGSTSMLLAGLVLVGLNQRRQHGKSTKQAA